MTVDDQARRQLHERLDDALGRAAAATLMEHLPPVGWADVATKADLTALEERIDARFAVSEARLDGRFAEVDGRFQLIEQRFDQRFDLIEQRFDQRFDLIEQRFDQRFDLIEQRFDQRFGAADQRFDGIGDRFDALEYKVLAAIRAEILASHRMLMFGIVSVVLTMAALAFSLVRFT